MKHSIYYKFKRKLDKRLIWFSLKCSRFKGWGKCFLYNTWQVRDGENEKEMRKFCKNSQLALRYNNSNRDISGSDSYGKAKNSSPLMSFKNNHKIGDAFSNLGVFLRILLTLLSSNTILKGLE